MRLLNTTALRLESFFGSFTGIPEYAILSHTWEDEEVQFDDIRDARKPLPVHKKGFAKIQGTCDQAVRDGYDYIWIDTCCIDKSSSAELSEAINSMFQWYHKAQRCYAYLADVNTPGWEGVPLERSRWFTRGWTLQELIAPRDVWFYAADWSFLGKRQSRADDPPGCRDLSAVVSERTGIPLDMLRWYRYVEGPLLHRSKSAVIGVSFYAPKNSEASAQLRDALQSFCVAQKMSWAASRVTTRLEDEAYCLMGLFDVNMPLLHGEGSKAFFRLQQEILCISNDQSIFAFAHASAPATESWRSPLLAESPRCFADSPFELPTAHVPVWPDEPKRLFESELTPWAKTLEMGLCLCPVKSSNSGVRAIYLGILDCVYRDDVTSHPAIFLEAIDGHRETHSRIGGHILRRVTPLDMGDPEQDPEYPGEMQADLTQASFTVVELNYHPHDKFDRKAPFAFLNNIDQLMSGIRLKLVQSAPHPLEAYGACPQIPHVGADRSLVHVPSAPLSAWRAQQAQRCGQVIVEGYGDGAFPIGVAVVRIRSLGDVVITWGKPAKECRSPTGMWFAVVGWDRIAEACGLSGTLYLDADLDNKARLLFERQEAWMKFVDTRFTPVVQAFISRCRIRFKAMVIDFFNRKVLSIELDVVSLKAENGRRRVYQRRIIKGKPREQRAIGGGKASGNGNVTRPARLGTV